MPDTTTALADLARDLASALTAFAEAIRPSEHADARPDRALDELNLGPRQQEIAELPQLNSESGMNANEVARAIDYDPANAHNVLKALTDRGVLEPVRTQPGESFRWRLAPSYRGSSDPYLRIAGMVLSGEWTTYGDVSVAVRGDTSGARAVGRAAATQAHFPNPHRVLRSGGRVPSAWKSHESAQPDPQECVRRLAREGVHFDERGGASRANYVSWDILAERSERDG
jgi:alkylated DNA nucleotide flippase Atl1